METASQWQTFSSISNRVGRFNLQGKTFLIPEMNRVGSHLLAAVFRAFGVNAKVMETYEGLDLGKQFTSGKECFPCVVTLGDILHFMQKEKDKLGIEFDPENYVYFMPEANGPCRFGMYNKYHRIILDGITGLDKVMIAAISSEDAYRLDGLIPRKQMRDFRKTAYLSVVVGDIIDRLLWRIRPYEIKEGSADQFIDQAAQQMSTAFSEYPARKVFSCIVDKLLEIINEAKKLIDPSIPRKPIIGLIGEIYVRSHVRSNQDAIKLLEKYGAEVVNASTAEWINYTTYDQLRLARTAMRMSLRNKSLKKIKDCILRYVKYKLTLLVQYSQQKKAYERVRRYIDIQKDHKIGEFEKVLKETDLFAFSIGTEACLSISAAYLYALHGFNGVVNIFPFTCMPSNLTSAITKPIMAKLNVPYLDVSYDGSFQPGRDSAIRTFMYQVYQHFKTYGRH